MKYMGELGLNFEVYRNDELTIEDVKRYTCLTTYSV
jgi:anthranilate synthase component II